MISAENGIRTHAGDCPPDLKSGSLPGFDISAYKKSLYYKSITISFCNRIYSF